MATDMQQDLENKQVPRITIVLTAMSLLVWLWLNFVSSAGFLAIGSQVTLSLATTYMLAISCSLYSRIYQPELLGRESNGIFQLGQFWGSVADVLGLCFLSLVWVLAWYVFLINYAGKDIADYEKVLVYDTHRCFRHQLCSDHRRRRGSTGRRLLRNVQSSALSESCTCRMIVLCCV